MKKRGSRVVIAVAAGLLASIAAGSIYSVIAARRELNADMLADEPSQKARILAENISEAMNNSVLLALFAIPIAVLLAWRVPKHNIRNGGISSDA